MTTNREKLLKVPADPHNHRARVTSGMKAAQIGAHQFTIEDACTRCLVEDHTTDPCPDCHGEGTLQRELTVPWDTVKKIYQDMVDSAVADRAQRLEAERTGLFHDLMAQVAAHADQHGRQPAAVFLDTPRWELLQQCPGWLVSDMALPFNPITRLYRMATEEPLLQLIPMSCAEKAETGQGS